MSGRKPKQGDGRASGREQEAPRGGRPRAVAEMLPAIGRASFRRFGFVQHAVVSRWAEIVGARYADVSAPESIRFPAGQRAGGALTLQVASAHAPMLQHVIPEIIARVNRFFGYPAIDRVVLRQGMTPRPRRAPAPAAAAPPAEIPVDLGDSLRAVGDPELRAVLEQLARGIANGDRLAVAGKVKA
jgi:hypothetical protein